ncbi:MAG: DUF1156 domain-containing protein [Thermomicrobiales bacterium]
MTTKKLIEVALPLEKINEASAREKSIRHGHPSTLHLWWSRKPLATARAVLFASLVDDPGSRPDLHPTPEAQDEAREALFRIIERLVQWESTTDAEVLDAARTAIRTYTKGPLPPVLDPFCGGGSIPLEAQRLGLEAHASDLNPVAVLITKALIEIPPKFAKKPPINPDARKNIVPTSHWSGAQGLAADVRYYGKWMRDEAARRIGHLYPKVQLPRERGGGTATVIAWLWVRTVRCPNPVCGARMPLTSKFTLSTKQSAQALVEPEIDRTQMPPVVRFTVRTGEGVPHDGTVNRRGATCICCGTAVPFTHVRAEGKAGRMDAQLMAIVAEGQRERIYLDATPEHVTIAKQAVPEWEPSAELPRNPRDFKTPNYGLTTFASLFTPRQLVALTTFSDLVGEVRERVRQDAIAVGLPDDDLALADGGMGATAYADAVATYLAISVDRMSDYHSSICSWHSGRDIIRNTFARQAIPMIWDFAEANPMSGSTGNFTGAVDWVFKVVSESPCNIAGVAKQLDATTSINGVILPLVCTDPPYYDNIGYANLSDFFYIWLRRSIGTVYPSLFSTMLVPKEELVATPYRFNGSKVAAERFFEKGLSQAFSHMYEKHDPAYPLTIFYAFKQAESDINESDVALPLGIAAPIASTGWETMLTGVIHAGFQITGTWPMRSELSNRPIANGTNALASSIVLVCRPRLDIAPEATRRQFLTALREELPKALRELQRANIAPVDLAQAAIGPGMAVFSRYAKVLEANGEPMRVRTALQLINATLDDVLDVEEGAYDNETRWAIAWHAQHGTDEGPYDDAETLSKAKNAAIHRLAEAGILAARGGKVRLLRRDELLPGRESHDGSRRIVWTVTQHLIRALENDGEDAAAALLLAAGEQGEMARDLAYRLYVTCERKGWAQEARAYNTLVIAWGGVTERAQEQRKAMPMQRGFFEG